MKKVILILIVLFSPNLQSHGNNAPRISIQEINDYLYVLSIGKTNLIVFKGKNQTLLSDTGYSQTGKRLKDTLKKLKAFPIDYIINTHFHNDHTGGNIVLGKNTKIIAHKDVKKYTQNEHKVMGQKIKPVPAHAQPDLTFKDEMTLYTKEEKITLTHLPSGHTSSDIIVYFTKANVLHTGDLIFADYYPFIDINNGGRVEHYLDNLRYIVRNFPEDTKLVPGHGRLYNMRDLIKYINTLQKTVNRVKQEIKKGTSLEKLKKKEILKDWEQYGKWFINEDKWIELIYTNNKISKSDS